MQVQEEDPSGIVAMPYKPSELVCKGGKTLVRQKAQKGRSQLNPLILKTPDNWGRPYIFSWSIKVEVRSTLFFYIEQLDLGDDVVDLVFNKTKIVLQSNTCQRGLFAVTNEGSMDYFKIASTPNNNFNAGNGMRIWIFQKYLKMQPFDSVNNCTTQTTSNPEATTPLATTTTTPISKFCLMHFLGNALYNDS